MHAKNNFCFGSSGLWQVSYLFPQLTDNSFGQVVLVRGNKRMEMALTFPFLIVQPYETEPGMCEHPLFVSMFANNPLTNMIENSPVLLWWILFPTQDKGLLFSL